MKEKKRLTIGFLTVTTSQRPLNTFIHAPGRSYILLAFLCINIQQSMKTINKPLHLCNFDDFPRKMVRLINIKRTKADRRGKPGQPPGRRLRSPTIPKNKKTIILGSKKTLLIDECLQDQEDSVTEFPLYIILKTHFFTIVFFQKSFLLSLY